MPDLDWWHLHLLPERNPLFLQKDEGIHLAGRLCYPSAFLRRMSHYLTDGPSQPTSNQRTPYQVRSPSKAEERSPHRNPGSREVRTSRDRLAIKYGQIVFLLEQSKITAQAVVVVLELFFFLLFLSLHIELDVNTMQYWSKPDG